jgi:acyl-CoA thioester hydrolase
MPEKHLTEIAVRWDELDANQHVNNKVYQSYLDEARIQAMTAQGVDFAKLRELKTGPVITRLILDFKAPLHHPDTACIYSWLENVEKYRSEFVQDIHRKSDGKLVCQARAFWAFMNLERGRPVLLGDILAGKLAS